MQHVQAPSSPCGESPFRQKGPTLTSIRDYTDSHVVIGDEGSRSAGEEFEDASDFTDNANAVPSSIKDISGFFAFANAEPWEPGVVAFQQT
jgi:hypothetical protein